MLYFANLLPLVAAATALAQQPSNPIQVSSSTFLGYRNSTNTQTVRDLGFMGNISGTWILSFGDGTPTKNIAYFNQSAPALSENGSCAYLSARDGGGYQSDNPLYYADITVDTSVPGCGDTPEMGMFCPYIDGEPFGTGMGITNVVQVNTTTGCIWTRPTINNTDLNSNGAGLALVTLDSDGTVTCTRPFGRSTWSQNEPDWGQLTAVDGLDGYYYVFANGYHSNGQESNTVVLTRAPYTEVFELSSYQYWHGATSGWTSTPIYISDLNDASAENLQGLQCGQGSSFYSTYYNKFVYLSTGNNNFGIDGPKNATEMFAWTADRPEGPWSAPVIIWNDTIPYVPIGPTGFEYGGYIMEKFTTNNGRTIYYSYTRGKDEFVITTECCGYDVFNGGERKTGMQCLPEIYLSNEKAI